MTQAAIKNMVQSAVSVSDLWEPPQSLLSSIAPESYPLDALPPLVRDAVAEVQGFTKAPAVLVASSALAALSVAGQALVDVKRSEKLSGPVGLFLLSIADSGERKSTCDGFFTGAIRDFERDQAELAKPELAKHRADFSAWEAEKAGVTGAIKNAAAKDGEKESIGNLRSRLEQLEKEKPVPPRIPKLIRGDDTPESLAWAMAQEYPSAGVLSSEAGLILGAHAMGKDTIMRNLGLLNILWDGGDMPISRRTSESFTVRGARFTMGLLVQEVTLNSFFERSGGLARGTGFFARFLVAWPESTQGTRFFSEAPSTWPNLALFNKRIADLLSMPASFAEGGGLAPTLLSLTPEAKTLWVAFHDTIEKELGDNGELYGVRDVGSKAADNVARLAALFHVLERGPSGLIEAHNLEGASRIVAWHLNEARRFFGELALPEEQADAVRLDAWLLSYCGKSRVSSVSRREIQRNITPVRLRKTERLNQALRELCEADRIREISGGRQKMIAVNPALLEGGCA